MKITIQNDLGVVKEVKVGFSWTNLFFGAFVPLVRGDVKWFLIQAGLALVTEGWSTLVFPFIYNRLYIKQMIKKGFYPTTAEGKDLLIEKNLLTG